MKRLIVGIAAAALFAAGAALAVTPTKATKHVPVPGEEYHHLLMLDMREAAEHAQVLRHYAESHGAHLDKAVVMKHVDELSKNLDGVRTELADLEQKIPATDKTSIDPQLTNIRTQEQAARGDLETLKAEAAKETPDAAVIGEKSKAIYAAMSAAKQHHQRAMAKRRVHEPGETPKS